MIYKIIDFKNLYSIIIILRPETKKIEIKN